MDLSRDQEMDRNVATLEVVGVELPPAQSAEERHSFGPGRIPSTAWPSTTSGISHLPAFRGETVRDSNSSSSAAIRSTLPLTVSSMWIEPSGGSSGMRRPPL